MTASGQAPPLVFLHTVQSNADTFADLLAEMAPDVPARHLVDESLLKDAMVAGRLTDDVRARTASAMTKAASDDAAVVLCTCSTVGPGADDAAVEASIPVLRIDRPMAEEAVRRASRIAVTASVETTIGPTVALLEEAAATAGRTVDLQPVDFDDAREKLVSGHMEAYLDRVAAGLCRVAADAELIVLAQASMAPALARCPDLPIPVLSSPRSGLSAAVDAYRGRT